MCDTLMGITEDFHFSSQPYGPQGCMPRPGFRCLCRWEIGTVQWANMCSILYTTDSSFHHLLLLDFWELCECKFQPDDAYHGNG